LLSGACRGNDAGGEKASWEVKNPKIRKTAFETAYYFNLYGKVLRRTTVKDD